MSTHKAARYSMRDLADAFGAVEYAHGLLDGGVGALEITDPECAELFVFENGKKEE